MGTKEIPELPDGIESPEIDDLTMSQLTEACGGDQPSREPSACTNLISLVHHSS